MHPGPINRGVEIASDIADDDENLIAHQVFSGLAVRMAILYRTIVGYSDGAGFDLAAKRLSADTLALKASGSAVEKGETLKDTAITLSAYSPDIIVMRHPSAGACQTLSANTEASVINAGDGKHQHPTQCLLDLFSMRQNLGRDLDGLKVFIIGDILHSRVARSDIMGFQMLGMDVTLVAPPTLMPRGIEEMGVKVEYDLANLKDADVIYLLRIQKERIKPGAAYLPSLREYSAALGHLAGAAAAGAAGHAPRPHQPRRRDRLGHRRRRREPDRPPGLQRPRGAHGDPVPDHRRLQRRCREWGGALMERTWCKPLPAAELLIKGGRVVDPESGVDAVQDVLVKKGKVAEVGKDLKAGKNTRVVDAAGMLVLPGFVDLHAHFRTPGREDEEDIATASAAAAAGGYVAAFGMANTDPVVDNAGLLKGLVQQAGRRRGRPGRLLRRRHQGPRGPGAHRDGRARRRRRRRLQRRRAARCPRRRSRGARSSTSR